VATIALPPPRPLITRLLASGAPAAKEAIDLFVYRIGRELGSLVAALGGLDALVFTGGIGDIPKNCGGCSEKARSNRVVSRRPPH
jgi:acetate kinase